MNRVDRPVAAMNRNPDAIFFEMQPLRNNKLFYIALLAGVGLIAFFAYAIYEQIGQGKPFGDRPMGDAALVIVGGLYMLLGAGLLWLFFKGGMTTEVRPTGVFVRHYPFHTTFKKIELHGLRRCEARTYRPMREYGGWGIKTGRGKRAYNVSGNRGVELEFEGGRKLLIGSKKPEQLANAIESIGGSL